MQASRIVRRLFALPVRRRMLPPVPAAVVDYARPDAGQITLVTGGSGGGKSRLLRAMRARASPGVRWIDPGQIELDGRCVVDRVCDELDPGRPPAGRVELALELLGRVGLAEAWTYLQRPAELSDGQRWRLLLALAVARATRAADTATPPARGEPVLITAIAVDEFAALLDRVTARIVARALRRLIDRPPGATGAPRLAAVVVTSHDDLSAALSPDRTVLCDFGEYRVGVNAGPAPTYP